MIVLRHEVDSMTSWVNKAPATLSNGSAYEIIDGVEAILADVGATGVGDGGDCFSIQIGDCGY